MTAKRQWTLMTALVCLLVLAAGFMLLVKPQNSKASSVRTETATTQGQVQSLRAQLSRLQEEGRNLASQQAVLAQIVQQLPAQPALPTLLRSLDAAAAQTNVDLTNVAPGNPTAFSESAAAKAAASTGTTSGTTTGSSTATTKSGSGSAVSGLAQIPVSMSVSGSYFDIEQFLNQLEGLQRSMVVNTFTIGYQNGKGGSASTPTVGAGELTVSIQAEVFMTTQALGSSAAPTTAH